MRLDVTDLMKFYESRLGSAAAHLISDRIDGLWGDLTGLDVLGIGYTAPFLNQLGGKPRRLINLMPAGQGGHVWSPTERGSTGVLSDEVELPFPDALFDRVLVVHALEETSNSQRFLREIWRVCAPEAHIIIVAPNRSGLWSLLDTTPFGHGRPFSRRQLKNLMRDALLEPTAWTRALYMPPFAWKMFTSTAEGWERVGEVFAGKLGGVNLVEGVKRVRANPGLPERARIVSPVGLRPALRTKKPLA